MRPGLAPSLGRVAWAASLVCGLAGCPMVHRTAPGALAALASQPGSHLKGDAVAFGEPLVLNREDFVYAADVAPSGDVVAFLRLGIKGFSLSVFELRPATRQRFDARVCSVEFDAEAVAFSPDGQSVAVASRDGTVRLFDARTGSVVATMPLGEPLTALAWHPDGARIAVGTSAGRLALLAWPGLAMAEGGAPRAAHADEVRGLAFSRQGTLFSASWDRTLAAWAVHPVSSSGATSSAAPEGGGPRAESAADALVELRRFTFPAALNDLTVDAAGARLGVAFSESKAQRTYEVYQRERRGELEPEREWDAGAIIDAATGRVLRRAPGHRGVVATAAVSPDGNSLATGGWDRTVILHGSAEDRVASRLRFGLAVRQVRFARDGRLVAIASWTPQVPSKDGRSAPAATVTPVEYRDAEVASAPP